MATIFHCFLALPILTVTSSIQRCYKDGANALKGGSLMPLLLHTLRTSVNMEDLGSAAHGGARQSIMGLVCS